MIRIIRMKTKFKMQKSKCKMTIQN